MATFYPPLRIHAWGGLGSQLFTVALALNVSDRFPKRRIVIFLHSSGVTRRNPEVCEIFPEFEYRQIEDFVSREAHDSKNGRVFAARLIRHLLKFIGIFMGLLAEENSDDSKRIRRWTIAVRGHYSHRHISDEFIDELDRRLSGIVKMDFSRLMNQLIIHYRLGDLLELSNKNPISPKRIGNALSSSTHNIFGEVFILSDSSEIAVGMLKSVLKNLDFTALELSSAQSIVAATHAKYFIGTSSKISYWIALLRIKRYGNCPTLMPIEDQETLLGLQSKCRSIEYYQ